MQIRDMRPDDYDALVALWTDAGLSFRPNGRDGRGRVLRELAGPCSIFLVAVAEGRMVAAVLGTHDGRKGWINRLAVHPAHRRQGIARALVDEVERRLDVLGIEIVTCLVEGWNADSMRLFDSLGFVAHDVTYFSRRKDPEV